MKQIQNMKLGELAAYICSELLSNGIRCVLSGGACVAIYSKNKFMSYDLDFIDNAFTPRKKIKEVLGKIGFYEENRYFKHKKTEYFIEFPSGPLSVGSEPVKEICELEFSTGKLLIISATDCVKDRLAAYFYWDDLQSLEQAILVSQMNFIDFKEIQRWVKAEKQETKFYDVRKKLINK